MQRAVKLPRSIETESNQPGPTTIANAITLPDTSGTNTGRINRVLAHSHQRWLRASAASNSIGSAAQPSIKREEGRWSVRLSTRNAAVTIMPIRSCREGSNGDCGGRATSTSWASLCGQFCLGRQIERRIVTASAVVERVGPEETCLSLEIQSCLNRVAWSG